MILKINNYILRSFLKAFFIVIGSTSVIISVVIISQQLFGMSFTKTEAIIILSASLLGIWRFMIVFFISMSASLMFMELGRTSQYVVSLTSGMSVMRFLKGPMVFSFILGIIIIFTLKNIEINLTEKSEIIIQRLTQSKEININLKDIDSNKNTLIINGGYTDGKLELKNVLFIKEVNNEVFEVIKAENAFFFDSQWTLKNAYVLNNNTKSLHKYDTLLILGNLTQKNLIKQIDASQKSLIKTSKQYTLYQLYDSLVVSGISNEDMSRLKIQLWSTLAIPFKLLYALMIVPIVIGNKAITRNGLKLNAIFMPQIVVGICTYAVSFFVKIPEGSMKYEFAFCFLPHIATLLIVLLIFNYKKYI